MSKPSTLATRYFKAYGDGDRATIAEMFADDMEHHTNGKPTVGKEASLKKLEMAGVFRFSVERGFGIEGWDAVEGLMYPVKDGVEHRDDWGISYVGIVEHDGEHLHRIRLYYDPQKLMPSIKELELTPIR